MQEQSENDDPVALYLRELQSIRPLSGAEEAEFFRQLRDSHVSNVQKENAERYLIENRLTLVPNIAQKYSSTGLPMLDLIQEGNIALMRAVESFATAPTGEFSEYAATRIEAAIEQFVKS